jgi:hypothetical protein
MTGKDDLGSFKISELRRPEVRSFQRSPSPKEDQGPTVGFPSIEERLEAQSIDDVAEDLRQSYEKLEAIADGDAKNKAAAKKAMVAYERTADLMEYLFATKQALQTTK